MNDFVFRNICHYDHMGYFFVDPNVFQYYFLLKCSIVYACV